MRQLDFTDPAAKVEAFTGRIASMALMAYLSCSYYWDTMGISSGDSTGDTMSVWGNDYCIYTLRSVNSLLLNMACGHLFNTVFFHSYLTLVYQRVFVGPLVTHPMGINKHRGDLLPMKIDR